jgi:hypothetical protein
LTVTLLASFLTPLYACGTEKRAKECAARCEAEAKSCADHKEKDCQEKGKKCAEGCL